MLHEHRSGERIRHIKTDAGDDLPNDEQMADNKKLAVKCALCSERICRTKQRSMTQTDGLPGKVIKDRWLHVCAQDSWVVKVMQVACLKIVVQLREYPHGLGKSWKPYFPLIESRALEQAAYGLLLANFIPCLRSLGGNTYLQNNHVYTGVLPVMGLVDGKVKYIYIRWDGFAFHSHNLLPPYHSNKHLSTKKSKDETIAFPSLWLTILIPNRHPCRMVWW